ncbi:ROK family transcriptional regulator [Cellulomonas fimi]|nr:ROK family transcriptional regulator [Cellulomonas fimi]
MPPRAVELLRAVHERPGLTRAEAAKTLDLGTGALTTLVNRLQDARMVAQAAAAPTGSRGRPTTALVPHPDGPLVGVGLVTHRSWVVRVVEVGGAVVAETTGGILGATDGDAVVRDLRRAVDDLDARLDGRVRAAGIAVPGPVRDNRWVKATLLDWSDQDVPALWGAVDRPTDVPLVVVGNDATLAAVGEARRGAARGSHTHLHLHLGIGMGGAVTAGGEALDGDHGAAGEFGHMPFGDPERACPCGAHGCWGRTMDGEDLARALGDPTPADPLAYSERVLDRAAAGDVAAAAAVQAQARSLGRGAAGLVNALDPTLVTLGGLAPRLLAVAPDAVRAAYRSGLMSYRRADPPPLRTAGLGDAAPLVGAAELVWDRLWQTG